MIPKNIEKLGMRLVLIEWVDSFGCSSEWQEIPDKLDSHVLICYSVGWLIQDNDKCKVLIPHVAITDSDLPNQGCGDMVIPTKSVLSMTEIMVTE